MPHSRDNDEEEDFESRDFSPSERAKVREMLKSSEFARKFWTTFGFGLKWVFATAVGLIAVKTVLGDYVKAFFR